MLPFPRFTFMFPILQGSGIRAVLRLLTSDNISAQAIVDRGRHGIMP
jgi:hypothetical protein